jgi:hypothetical protein
MKRGNVKFALLFCMLRVDKWACTFSLSIKGEERGAMPAKAVILPLLFG